MKASSNKATQEYWQRIRNRERYREQVEIRRSNANNETSSTRKR